MTEDARGHCAICGHLVGHCLDCHRGHMAQWEEVARQVQGAHKDAAQRIVERGDPVLEGTGDRRGEG